MDYLCMSYANITPHEFSYLAGKTRKPDGSDLHQKLSHAGRLDQRLLMDDLDKRGVSYITIEDKGYPVMLKEIYDPPYILYYRGDISILDAPVLGVVGSRKATSYTRHALLNILPALNKKIAIVSGLAYGADEMAHHIAIDSGLKTIGVLAFGFDIHYPKTTEKLRMVMEKEHLVISEYPPRTPIDKWRFVARNRIISGFSKGVVVTEAEEKSGSLITLDMALNENRIAYCVPGNITSSISKGTNLRLQEGAKPVLSAEDIMEDFYV
ncbi:DNA-processing protein DprA [Salinicoccus albus]|uniref:DNA-processing protein DprA n=1 Tax=Salinicoccus albus TaxID=418756 RepID=UPI00035CCE7D|nr:DNA-processing protein DprA [Salinicoccus albus]